mmetsp:Transcript_9142/g.15637  ORF Transcript_9142/g.15637 Transcript_9142/m.15637 type:complete len:214 (+) Transcript_9142:244-885(+)
MLMLSAINLPGGVQRRRTQEDELNMRTLFQENDLISAEVQQFYGDGTMALHTRSHKYGKLEGGVLVKVPPLLIKRSKQHFHSLPCGVDVILANNGYCWVAPARPPLPSTLCTDSLPSSSPPPSASPMDVSVRVTSAEVREKVARVRNAIEVLGRACMAISAPSVMLVYSESLQASLAPHAMLHPNNLRAVTALARAAQDQADRDGPSTCFPSV